MQKALNLRIYLIVILVIVGETAFSADIAHPLSDYRLYQLLDELASYGLIDLNSAVKPYGKKWISRQLLANSIDSVTNRLPARIRQELEFQLQKFTAETPKNTQLQAPTRKNSSGVIRFWPPEFNYTEDEFQASIRPVMERHLITNGKGTLHQEKMGVSFFSYTGKHLGVYGSVSTLSNRGDGLLSKAGYLTNEPGVVYTKGTEYSESKGGIVVGNHRYSLSLTKDEIIRGDNLNGSNLLSGRAPTFPSLNLRLKPADWFEFTYFHGWLVSNLTDSTRYYVDNLKQKHYRPHKKYMASNFLTFTPLRGLKISVGNAVVYAEDQPYPGFFIPLAFYKSIDHATTKEARLENQNSQLLFNISSRNIKHLHLFSSVYIDDVQWRRFLPDSRERNPISYKLGAQLSNFPFANLSIGGEYTCSNILNYKHSIPVLSWSSNSYNLGHYLGDNARELYLELMFKPISGLDIKLYFLDAMKGNEYEYIRRGIFNNKRYTVMDIISNPSPGDVIWTNQSMGLNINYEIFRNVYAVVNLMQSTIQGRDAKSAVVFGEQRMTAQEAINRYTPKILHGKNTTLKTGISLNF